VSLAAAYYRAVAVDLRGYGGSDKPPRGYDLITGAADAAGLIRALGEANAAVVGHDWGGLVAWTLASYFPKSVRRLAVVSMAHPLQLRTALAGSPLRITRSLSGAPPSGAAKRGGYPLAFQLPLFPERLLVRDSAALVGSILSSWSAPGWPDEETARVYQRAMRIPPVAHTSLEYPRWFVRSAFRPDGLRYARHMRSPITVPTLHLHGTLDPCVPPQTARGAGRYVEAPYRWKIIDGAGHFPHEERPELSTPNCSAGWPTQNLTGERFARQGPGGQAANAHCGRARQAAAADRGRRRRRAAGPRRLGGHPRRGGAAWRQPAGRRPPVPGPRGLRSRLGNRRPTPT
jgi:pimeloyl-ACP methyl ester carboxylesterase